MREVEPSAESPQSVGLESVECRFCGYLNDSRAALCTHCRAPLVVAPSEPGRRATSASRRHPRRIFSPRIRRRTGSERSDSEKADYELGADEVDETGSATAGSRGELRQVAPPRHADSSASEPIGPMPRTFGRRRRASDSAEVLWEGRLSLSARLKQWIPEPVLHTLRKITAPQNRLRIVVAIVSSVVVVAAAGWVLTRPGPRKDRVEQVGIALEVPPQWQDVPPEPAALERFAVGSKVQQLGATPSMVLVDGQAAMAVLWKETATDTAPAEVAISDFDTLALVYRLSSDTREVARSSIGVFGTDAYSVLAERRSTGPYWMEEIIVAPLEGKVVYVVYTAPQESWDKVRTSVLGILATASH